ncbi:arabinoxylan hydrolase [Apodospora peruviana]|uniref:Arabinoxylan hydrolase n=1 Tax=Apodospora peruviana TaxID=516989 RepID=A0AAE0HT15_9PEZI|nr:arabinoxylan hydrolase [Apodospora peruviana]
MRGLHTLSAMLLARSVGTLATENPVSPRAAAAATFNNPVIWEDHPDLDVFRVGDVFYYSSSTFAYSPGAPVLRSYDLVNWEAVSHSVPELNFGAKYNLNGSGSGYVKGIWASSLRYRPSTDTFHWMGCVESGKTYIWTAPGNGAAQKRGEVSEWTWTNHPPINTCYYDCGILVDDDKDETMYVAYGNPNIRVAQLSKDGLTQVKTQQVYTSSETIEGSRMYKINGTYYILVTRPAYAEYVLKSTSGPFGPYTMKTLVSRINGPLANAGFSHQGGIVNTPDNKWYYVAFMDSYPSGRIPVVAPLTWTADGWPQLVADGSGGWGKSYPIPVQTNKTVASPIGVSTDEFKGTQLSHEWEWNHNPDKTKFRLVEGSGLVLQTADVTTDLFAARNTLTHRIIGPKSTGTFRIDVSKMGDGDRAGMVLFRDRSAYIGVHKDGSTSTVVTVNALTMSEGSWTTTAKGTVAAKGPTVSGGDIWLRIQADITPAFGMTQERTATFSYSTDGKTFTALGPAFAMTNSWTYFTGYRYGVFNFATKALGGEVAVRSFSMQLV